MVTIQEIKSANTAWSLQILERRLNPNSKMYKKKLRLIQLRRKKIKRWYKCHIVKGAEFFLVEQELQMKSCAKNVGIILGIWKS